MTDSQLLAAAIDNLAALLSSLFSTPDSEELAALWSIGFVLPMSCFLIAWTVGIVVSMLRTK